MCSLRSLLIPGELLHRACVERLGPIHFRDAFPLGVWARCGPPGRRVVPCYGSTCFRSNVRALQSERYCREFRHRRGNTACSCVLQGVGGRLPVHRCNGQLSRRQSPCRPVYVVRIQTGICFGTGAIRTTERVCCHRQAGRYRCRSESELSASAQSKLPIGAAQAGFSTNPTQSHAGGGNRRNGSR